MKKAPVSITWRSFLFLKWIDFWNIHENKYRLLDKWNRIEKGLQNYKEMEVKLYGKESSPHQKSSSFPPFFYLKKNKIFRTLIT